MSVLISLGHLDIGVLYGLQKTPKLEDEKNLAAKNNLNARQNFCFV